MPWGVHVGGRGEPRDGEGAQVGVPVPQRGGVLPHARREGLPAGLFEGGVPPTGTVVRASVSVIMSTAPAPSMTMWDMTRTTWLHTPPSRTTAILTGHSWA
ncbi:hypothetical protein GCM10027610_066460 [Dactylosporangium cerinum]